MNKEQIYDSQISPLIAQVIAICKEHKIAHVCAFTLDAEEGLCCITANTRQEFEPEERLIQAAKILYKEPARPLMVTTKDAGGNTISSEAIFP